MLNPEPVNVYVFKSTGPSGWVKGFSISKLQLWIKSPWVSIRLFNSFQTIFKLQRLTR
jgi:hypothetical protein